MTDWGIFKGNNDPHDGIRTIPLPPPWRTFTDKQEAEGERKEVALKDSSDDRTVARGKTFRASEEEIEMVNTALYLRRPLLITGKPGIGKSSLAYAVAYELKLGSVLYWPITTRSTVQEGLYRYDAIGRLQETNMKQGSAPDIGQFIRLGPLGTALIPSKYPRVLLIDEIDKSDIDLPNDLLNIFEEGEFEIPELARLPKELNSVQVRPHDSDEQVSIVQGRVRCQAFPFIVMTSNGEREFPPPFLRRCIRLDIRWPEDKAQLTDKLTKIVEAHLFNEADDKVASEKRDNLVKDRDNLIEQFIERGKKGGLATDQLLNAIYLTTEGVNPLGKDRLIAALYKHLTGVESK